MARKDRVKPTHYPFLSFHIIRCVQLVSSIVVASVMSYFLHELAQDGFRLPWTFILVRTTLQPCLSSTIPTKSSLIALR